MQTLQPAAVVKSSRPGHKESAVKIRVLIVLLGVLLGFSAKAVFPAAERAAQSAPVKSDGAKPPIPEAAPPDATGSAVSPPGSRVDGDFAE